MLRGYRPLKPVPGRETCEVCRLGFPSRELQEVEYDGRRVKACRACRAKVLEKKLRRERQKEIGGQLMW